MLFLLLFSLFLFLSQTAFLLEIRNFIKFHTYKKNYIKLKKLHKNTKKLHKMYILCKNVTFKSSILLEKELLLYLLIEPNFPFSKSLF